MNWQNMWRLAKSDYVKLVPILALAFYIVFIPHLTYPYPVHIDEWVHMAFSNGILSEGGVDLANPFSGAPMVLSHKLEVGFQLFWGVFQQISGISWANIFRYFPSIVFVITVLSVYVMAKREGFGWEAALFTCLIPTNVGIMGPALLVPVSMALLFAPLCLYVAFNFRTVWSYLLLFVLVCFLISIHGPSAICVILILLPYIILNLRGNVRHSLGMTLALFGPFLLTLPLTHELALSYGQSLLGAQPPSVGRDLPSIMLDYGYLVMLSCILGIFGLALRGGKKNYSLVLGLLVMSVMLATFYTIHYGMLIIYVRGLLFAMLMMGIIAGAGLMEVRRFRLPEKISLRLKVPLVITQNVGLILCLVLIGFTLATAIPSRLDEPYYHMIDHADYEAFVWIKENVGDDYEKAILDPWKATAFTAITGKHIHTRIHFSARDKDREAYAFLKSGCVDTTFLNENGITIVYNRAVCSNPNLVEVRKNVYLLKEVED